MDTDDLDLREHLVRSFGDGPAHRPIEDRLAAGQRALLRRRVGTGLVAAAVVAVLGTSYAVTSGGSDRAVRDPGYATSDRAVPDERERLRGQRPAEPPQSPEPVSVELVDGEVVVGDGVRILRRTENPLGYAPPATSVGLAVVEDGAEEWVLLGADDRGRTGFSVSEPARKRLATFDDWLADQVAFQRGSVEQAPVSFSEGTLGVTSGVTLLEKVLAPPEAAAYGPVDETAAAKVRLPDGRVRFVLALAGGRPSDTVVLDPAVLEAPTMAAFLDHLARQGESGEGLR